MSHISIFSLLIGLFTVTIQSAFAQSTNELFMTKSYKKALQNNSRSFDGKPGNSYWQNQVDYQIKASFDVNNRVIDGSEIITYSNNSPDTLKMLYFDLIQDLFKKGTARDWDLGQTDLHKGVNIKSLKIDGVNYELSTIHHNASKMIIRLQKYFVPNTKHQIEVSWSLIIPGIRTVRMGTYHKTNFMIAYWFPKLAVYDDIYGWATTPHTGNCEYYNEYGNYDVQIKAPKGYMLWATAVLQNKEEVYRKNTLKKIEQAAQSDEVIHITTAEEISKDKVLLKGDSLTWKFKAEQTPDFAFALSKDYIWDGLSTVSGDKRIMINAVYQTSSSDFKTVADVAKKSVDFFTNESPKINYPYPQITIFNGGGGMEFPGMVNDGDSRDYTGTLFVTSHEIGHSYFPFNTGLNEQLYAWMDEGLITFFPRKVINKYIKDSSYNAFTSIIKSYNDNAGTIREIPLMIPSTNTGSAYRYQAYSRSSVAFYTLSEYLGADTFDLALSEFSKRWKQKHPSPFDFFNTFNQIAGEDLAWFWKPWFFELGYADLAIEVENDRMLTIINKGSFPVPIHLTITFKDGSIETMNVPASIWKDGKKQFSVNFNKKELAFTKLELDIKTTADAFPEDNIWETK